MQTRIYVDFENVASSGITGISNLKEDDSVIIFYTTAADKLRFAEVVEVKDTKAEVRVRKVESGTKNALDFQLLTILFLDQKKEGDAEYIIVSNDRGYDAAIMIAKENGSAPLRRASSIREIVKARKHVAEEDMSEPVEEEDMFEPADDNWGLTEMDFGEAPSDMSADGTGGIHDTGGAVPEEKNDDDETIPATASSIARQHMGSAQGHYTQKLRWKRIRMFLGDNGIAANDDECRFISNTLNETKSRAEFYKMFVRHYGMKAAPEYYNKVKKFYVQLAAI